jgi:hypothetical protein
VRRLLVPAAFVAGLFGLADPAGALDQDTLRSPVRLSVVFGTVVDHETEVPIENATVSLGAQPDGARGTGTRVTDEAGRFRFEEVMPGTYTLTVAGFGYRTMEDTLRVGQDSDVNVSVDLSASPIVLAPIVVTTSRLPAFMVGFEERRARDRNHTAFFTRDDIESRNLGHITDLIAMTPGVWVTPTGPFGNDIRFDGGCRPAIWVDGNPFADFPQMTAMAGGRLFGVDATIQPDEVEAVEVYTRRHDVPQQFGPACGALVIWLRQPDPDEKRAPEWRRWLLALGVFGAGVLMFR